MNFSKLLNQKASHVPSGKHALNEEYYERIEAIQFTMAHDDGNLVEDVGELRQLLRALVALKLPSPPRVAACSSRGAR